MDEENPEYASSKKGKFRFKSQPSSRERAGNDSEAERDKDSRHRHHRRHRHHHHHRRHHKRKRSPDDKRGQTQPPPLSPNAAFRESLFDALADDEGAAYWEGVYGQPIHTYQRPGGGSGEGQGELESMTDEEYASYVRARMWEKTHQGLLEEQERRRIAREKMAEERKRAHKAESEREAFQRMVDESLRRGQERQTKKRKVNAWKEVWKRYLQSWEELNRRAREATSNSSSSSPHDSGDDTHARESQLRNLIVWPVESGKRRDVTPQAVREFIHNGPISSAGEDSSSTSQLLNTLKAERVRWHPDKIQHRYGMLGVEDQLIKSVTEVFQILDRMWVEERAKLEKQ